MLDKHSPLWLLLDAIRKTRHYRAQAKWRTYRDIGSYSDQQWWDGYAAGYEEMLTTLDINACPTKQERKR